MNLRAFLVSVLLALPGTVSGQSTAQPDTTAYRTHVNPILSLPRLAWELATYPVGKFVIYAEHHDIKAQLYDFFINESGTFGILPQIQLGGETGTGGTLRIFALSRSRQGPALDARLTYSGARGQQGQLVIGHPAAFGSEHGFIRLEGDVLNTYHADASINGALHDNPARSLEIFCSDSFFRIGWRQHIGLKAETDPNVELELWAGHAMLDFDARTGGNEPLTDPDVTSEARKLVGIGRTFSYARVGGRLTFDQRDYRAPIKTQPHPLYEHMIGQYAVRVGGMIHHLRDRSYPRRGFLFEMSGEWARGGDRVQFARGRTELQAYLPLFRKGQVLALRGKVEKIHVPKGSLVPFTDLITLGGAEDARGFRRANFRGLGSLVLNVEYRYPIWDSWNAFLFWDEGQVFDALSDASIDGFHTSYGGGISMRAARRLLAKLQIGHSRENNVLVGLAVSQDF